MTQFSSFPAVKAAKRLLLFASLLFTFNASRAQTYYVNLSGPSEVPPNNSAGTGKGLVTISGNMMRVQVSFSGLTGTTTASHIHAPTATAGAGTAGVATTTPTFTDFPLGVKAGTYDHTFDMTQASSYNPSYITANGGTPASAFVMFKASVSAGKSYLNIHSSFAMGGEIRGFLVACPTIMVSIPDAFALAQGVLPNTVYPAYTPARSLTLQANVTGGTAPYSYTWSNGSNTNTTTVSPTANSTYSVMVQDQNGCSGMSSKMVSVIDISGGKHGQNIVICHKGKNSLTIEATSVADHIGHGDMLGNCPDGPSHSITAREIDTRQTKEDFSVKVLSNPSPNYFDLQLNARAGSKMQLKVFDLQGRVVESKALLQSNQTVRLGTTYIPGVYIVQITGGAELQTLRLVKTR